jgi:HSP20 family molecular chaperone IbpA
LDIDDVKAGYDKGILTITIPRHAREIKKIEIE